MTRSRTFLALLVGLTLAAALPALAENVIGFTSGVPADTMRPGGTTDIGALRVGFKGFELYDSGSVAAGAAIDSGVLDTSNATILTVYVSKGDTTSRVPTVTFYRSDGTTSIGSVAHAGCAATACQYNYGITAAGGTVSIGMSLPPKLRFALASGGAVAGRVTAVVR